MGCKGTLYRQFDATSCHRYQILLSTSLHRRQEALKRTCATTWLCGDFFAVHLAGVNPDAFNQRVRFVDRHVVAVNQLRASYADNTGFGS